MRRADRTPADGLPRLLIEAEGIAKCIVGHCIPVEGLRSRSAGPRSLQLFAARLLCPIGDTADQHLLRRFVRVPPKFILTGVTGSNYAGIAVPPAQPETFGAARLRRGR